MSLQLRQLYKKVDKTVATEVKKLATPVILSNISRTMMSFVDVMMVGHLGSKALAATGMGYGHNGRFTLCALSGAVKPVGLVVAATGRVRRARGSDLLPCP